MDVENLSGALLVAHPALTDPNFKQAVILISADTPDDGTIGVIINRPLGYTLGDHVLEAGFSPLADVPLYQGGPVQEEQILLAAWNWQAHVGLFQMHFGISEEKAIELRITQPDTVIRAFLGYAGWGKGQLANERAHHTWLVTPVTDAIIHDYDSKTLWRMMLRRLQPDLLFLAELPDDPSRN